MNNRLFRIFGAAALAAGLMVAQTAGTGENPAPHRGMQMLINRATKALNLTSTQQTELQQIITEFQTTVQPVHQKLKTDQEALIAAAKANPKDTATLNAKGAAVASDLTAITVARAQAFGEFYGILQPQQQQQVDAAGDHFMMFGGPRGFGRGR